MILIHITNDDTKEEKLNDLVRIIFEISSEIKNLQNPVQKYLHSRVLFLFQTCIFAMYIGRIDLENIAFNFDKSVDYFFDISYSHICNKVKD